MPKHADVMNLREKEILPYPDVFRQKIKDVIIPMISNERFLDSWRGTFITKDFDEECKKQVLSRLNEFILEVDGLQYF